MLSLFVLSLTFALTYASHGFSYFEEPLTFEDAKQYCSDIGSQLATIDSDAHRLEALSEINGRDAPWIGLEHGTPGPNNFKCHFYFPAEPAPDHACPLYPLSWHCVPFWKNDRPRILTDGGYECTTFDPIARNQNGGVDNETPCDEERPFLCDAAPQTCDVEDFDCYVTTGITWCESTGGAFGIGCFCDFDANSESRCISNYWCGAQQNCNPALLDGDCPEGSVCVTQTCCGGSQCTPLCGEDVTVRRRLTESEVKLDESKVPWAATFCSVKIL